MGESRTVDVVRVGLIGCGTVGAAFADAVLARRAAIAARYGVWLELTEIAVARPERRGPALAGARVHGDGASLADNAAIDVVVEASTARRASMWIRSALSRGAAVVTANKAAVAGDPVLLATLVTPVSSLWCEAAVGGAVPIVRGMRESLAGADVRAISGVLNGTTTFVLSQLERGGSFDDAVRAAQRAGYAEADPSADLSGADATAKLAILATLAWGEPVSTADVITRGINGSTLGAFQDVLWNAGPTGYRVRLVASASRSEATGVVRAFVAPQVLTPGDALFATQGVENVIEVETALAGKLCWRGPGAGGPATASALLADTIAAALTRSSALTLARAGAGTWRE